jgi:Asp-tRNA(Asn)/Glu-tRNA(Gln) amidotransferase A subunit family amidase
MKTEELCWLGASELARLIKKRDLSPIEITETFVRRIEQYNPKANAFVTVDAELAIQEAKKAEEEVMKGKGLGPLHGIPFSVKDVTFTKNVPTTFGSNLMRDFVPSEDSVMVARLRNAGAILLGKTNTSEFAHMPNTENRLFGRTANPWDSSKSAGGSSGGSAVAVATGLIPLATGSDAGGSIRIPASCCGVFGLKPQFGRVPISPSIHLCDSLNHEGPITRNVEDAATVLDIISGYHWTDPYSLDRPSAAFSNSWKKGVRGLRVGWSADLGYANVSRIVMEIFEKAVRAFVELGCVVKEANISLLDFENLHGTIMDTELAASLAQFWTLEDLRPEIDPLLFDRVQLASKFTALDYSGAMIKRKKLALKVWEFFQNIDLLLTPTIGVPPWPIQTSGKRWVKDVDGKPVTQRGWLLTFPFNHTGQPAASIPAGWTSDGLPVGVQIVGPAHGEATVLSAAAAFESASPWNDFKPLI